jgi:hypothetical protein
MQEIKCRASEVLFSDSVPKLKAGRSRSNTVVNHRDYDATMLHVSWLLSAGLIKDCNWLSSGLGRHISITMQFPP